MHNSAEYVLKTGQRLARATAKKRNSWKMGEDGLYRAPKAVTKWALKKPCQGWSAKSSLEQPVRLRPRVYVDGSWIT